MIIFQNAVSQKKAGLDLRYSIVCSCGPENHSSLLCCTFSFNSNLQSNNFASMTNLGQVSKPPGLKHTPSEEASLSKNSPGLKFQTTSYSKLFSLHHSSDSLAPLTQLLEPRTTHRLSFSTFLAVSIFSKKSAPNKEERTNKLSPRNPGKDSLWIAN